ncbi:MAG: response regulator transcription factor [Ardenticatenaceae bacterium]|nr:response regulator transcription factor [Anaerolineales bacterium]MCB8982278.1 response regulator transcription factor [Ardenticatenaceae bacterium]MCB8987068.1 response regulator transcription factor [Ardenticatenaceae bacterium]
MDEPIKILIVEDHHLVREGLVALLDVKPDLEVVGVAADGDEAVQQFRLLQPDVILLDVKMPNKDGISAIREIREENPAARILVLSSFSDVERVRAALEAGAMGYQLKDSSPAELLQSIHAVYQGQMPLHPLVARKILSSSMTPTPSPAATEELTDRETAVLELIAFGYSNREIAQELGISVRTVSTHVSRILSKLNLENRTQAALHAFREGLIDRDMEL